MSNPLIDKYFELYPEKKEEPKKEYLALSEEQMDVVSKYLTTPDKYSTVSVTNVNPNSVSAITAANHISHPFKTLTSYDRHSGEDSFLQIAEKIKNKDARVTSVTLNRDSVGLFTTYNL